MRQWLRHHHYALRVALRRLLGQPFSCLANVLVVALSLTLPLVGMAVLSSTQPVLGQLRVDAQITVFLARDTNTMQLQQLARRLQTEDGVAQLRIVPRDQALAQLKTRPGWAEAFAVLPPTPSSSTCAQIRRGTQTPR